MPGCQNPKQLREREHRHTGSPRTESGPRLGALPSLGVPTIPPLLTKPLSMTRHRLLRVSASLVKWNWTRREFRNRGTSVVCGVGVGGLGEAGPGPQNPPQPAPAQPTHQQLLWDKLHVELPRPLLRPPVGQTRGSAKGRPFSTPPPPCPLHPSLHSQDLPLVHVDVGVQTPLRLAVGLRPRLWGRRGDVRAGQHSCPPIPASMLTSCHSMTPLHAKNLLLTIWIGPPWAPPDPIACGQ